MNVKETLAAARKAVADGDMEQAQSYKAQAEMLRDLGELEPTEEVKAAPVVVNNAGYAVEETEDSVKSAPNINKLPSDAEYTKALAGWIRSGKQSSILDDVNAAKASNDNTTTVADPTYAGYAVPTGHYQGIIAKARENNLRDALGLMMIPGQGTTVNVTTDAHGDAKFVTTAEQDSAHAQNFDRDAPTVARVPMTLVKKTKKIELTDELMEDEDSRLMEWIETLVGQGLARTWNEEIVTKALAGGTAAVTFASATAIAASEVPELMYSLPAGYEGGAQWVMSKNTGYAIYSMQGDVFLHRTTPAGTADRPSLWGHDVNYTLEMPDIASTATSLIHGNFNYMGYREAPGLTLLRDPYSTDGVLTLKYYVRMVAEVLQPLAIRIGTQAA